MNDFKSDIEAMEYLNSVYYRSKFNPDLVRQALHFVEDELIIKHFLAKIDKQTNEIAHRQKLDDNHRIGRYYIKKHRALILETLKARDGDFCQRCKKHFERYDIDHITPLKEMGDPESMDNLQLTCGKCNRIWGERPKK